MLMACEYVLVHINKTIAHQFVCSLVSQLFMNVLARLSKIKTTKRLLRLKIKSQFTSH